MVCRISYETVRQDYHNFYHEESPESRVCTYWLVKFDKAGIAVGYSFIVIILTLLRTDD